MRCRILWMVSLWVGLALVACSSPGRKVGSGAKDVGVVVSPLSAEVRNPEGLLLVNTISVEKPVFRGPTSGAFSEQSLQAIVREVAEETLSMKLVGGARGDRDEASNYDGVIRTEILSLEELKGSSVGGEPARVAFRIGVYQKGGKEPVWQGHYVYRQEAVTDNWLKLRDRIGKGGTGAGWITAQEIFRRGVTSALMDFNQRRDSVFQGSRASQ